MHVTMQAVLFEVKDRHMVGYASPSGYRYCCTKELVSKTKCHQDRLILQVSHLCLPHPWLCLLCPGPRQLACGCTMSHHRAAGGLRWGLSTQV